MNVGTRTRDSGRPRTADRGRGHRARVPCAVCALRGGAKIYDIAIYESRLRRYSLGGLWLVCRGRRALSGRGALSGAPVI